ncbi:MAG: GAF domain-containing protein, partial [Myxococcales bacterium]|nr:GAF domain-containing protein [Myxococcales bacterium]
LARVLAALLEQARGVRGALVLGDAEAATVEARMELGQSPRVGPSVPLGAARDLPAKLVQRVLRAQHAVVLGDPDEADVDDPYLRGRPALSVLCVPIVRGGDVRGAVYLENDLVEHAFSSRQIVAVQTLAAQAAIAIENARLYESLDAQVRERTEALEVALARAQVASRVKSTFLATMSHELKTPLNAILGYADYLRERATLDTEGRKGVETIRRSGAHLLGVIDDILDMARLEAGRVELDPRPAALRDLAREAVDFVAPIARRKGLRLAIDADGDLPARVEVDASRLRQVLLNLLDNAVKFAVSGQVTLRLTVVRAEPASVRVRVEVEDTGPGIDAARLGSIFEPFEQAGARADRSRGTGLGLAITQGIVELMGGEIGVRSTPGVGSTFGFELELPVTDGRPMPTPTPRPSTRDPVVPLPAPDRARLAALAEAGKLTRVAELAHEIAERDPRHAAMAQRIEALAFDFDDRAILALLADDV